MMLGELFVKLSMQSDQFRGQLGQVQGQLGSLTNTANLARLALTGIAGGAAIGGTIHLYGQLEDAQLRLSNIVRATGGSAGFTTSQLRGMADAMRGVTTETKAGVLEAIYNLEKFSAQLRGPEFAEALKKAQSLSNLTGMGLGESAEILGRSLEDPAGMIHRFQRSTHVYMGGPQMEKQIEALQNAGQIQAAQRMFMQQIPDIGLPDSIFTQLARLKQEFADAGATVGNWFVPSLKSGMLALKDLGVWFNGLSDAEKAAAGSWTTFILQMGGGGFILLKTVGLLQGWTHSLGLMQIEMGKSIKSGAALSSVLGSLSSAGLWGAVAALGAMHASLLLTLQAFREYEERVTKVGFKTGPIDEKMKADYDNLTPEERRAKAVSELAEGRKQMGKATAVLNNASPDEVRASTMAQASWFNYVMMTAADRLQGREPPHPADSDPLASAKQNQQMAQARMATAQRVLDELNQGIPPRPLQRRETQFTGLADTWFRIAGDVLGQTNPQLDEAKKQTALLQQIASTNAKMAREPPQPPPKPGLLAG